MNFNEINVMDPELKEKITASILKMYGSKICSCIKMSIGNILLPQWNEENLMSYLFRQCVKTKEAPLGEFYDAAEFTPVLRLVDNVVLDERDQTDSYCWSKEMVANNIDNAVPIGGNSGRGIVTMSKIIMSIRKPADQMKLANFFSKYNEDLLYVETPETQRKCIVVTQELYDAGLTWCIDQWSKQDDNGEWPITELEVGDVLIVDTGVYCCRKNVFAKTYKF